MAEKHNDDKGYQRGAKGIDGKEGENYTREGRDRPAENKMFGRSWNAPFKKGHGLSD